jgi:hypothetical protein
MIGGADGCTDGADMISGALGWMLGAGAAGGSRPAFGDDIPRAISSARSMRC